MSYFSHDLINSYVYWLANKIINAWFFNDNTKYKHWGESYKFLTWNRITVLPKDDISKFSFNTIDFEAIEKKCWIEEKKSSHNQ